MIRLELMRRIRQNANILIIALLTVTFGLHYLLSTISTKYVL